MNTTVVLPVKNEAAIIEDRLQRLLLQTVLPTEVIVVNNNSSDETATIVERFTAVFADAGVQFSILSCPEGNQANARVMGFGKAQTDLIISIDADTSLPPRWIENAIAIFTNNPSLAGAGGPMIYQHWAVTTTNLMMQAYLKIRPEQYFFYGSNAVFRRTAYHACGGLTGCHELMLQEQFQEPYDDLFLSLRLHRVGTVRSFLGLKAFGILRVGGKERSLWHLFQRWRGQRRETRVIWKAFLEGRA